MGILCCGVLDCQKEGEVKRFSYASYCMDACCSQDVSCSQCTKILPFDCCLNEFLFCVNGCYRTLPKKKKIVPENYDVTQEEPTGCCYKIGVWGENQWKKFLGCLYKMDQKEFGPLPVATPDDSAGGKIGVLKSYEEFKNVAEDGDLIVSGSNDTWGAMIEGLTNSNLNHCATIIDPTGKGNKDEFQVWQATIWSSLNGCGARPMQYIVGHDYALSECWAFLLKLDEQSKEKLAKHKQHVMKTLKAISEIQVCWKKSNRRYDMANCQRLRMAFKQLRRSESKWSKEIAERYIQVNNNFYGNCSEYCSTILKAAGIIEKEVNDSFVTPESLTWIKAFSGYYQICLPPKMIDVPEAKYIQHFNKLPKKMYTKAINDFWIEPPAE